jgi:antitoxin (DNA-binding transcriptional repressor) of toxin-antitoxin stability system
MKTVTMHKAKSTLSQLVADAESGEEIIIMRGKVPVARLTGLASESARKFGALAGSVSVTQAFFEPLPDDELRPWER